MEKMPKHCFVLRKFAFASSNYDHVSGAGVLRSLEKRTLHTSGEKKLQSGEKCFRLLSGLYGLKEKGFHRGLDNPPKDPIKMTKEQ